MLLEKETFEKFGYSAEKLLSMSGKKVVVRCPDCSAHLIKTKASYSQGSVRCSPCARKRAHADPNSGYHNESYKQRRSEIATRSNRARKEAAPRFQQYLQYIDAVKNGKITFTEIGTQLGLDNSTVCKFFHKNFQLKSRFGGRSLQEDVVFGYLKEIFTNVKRGVRYDPAKRSRSDYFVKEIGHIEYDGAGFYHYFKPGDRKAEQYGPSRLNAQAYFGGVDYLRFALLGQGVGYSSVLSSTIKKEYSVREMINKKAIVSMLENCHPLGVAPSVTAFGLYYGEKLIGAAQFGIPTNHRDNGKIELRRFFVLDGTPKNTESFFLRACERHFKGKTLVTYIHAHEKGTYLKALGWTRLPYVFKEYDFYFINHKLVSKRKMFGWAKKTGFVEKFGTTSAKEILAAMLGGEKVIIPSKIKFEKRL